MPRPPTPSAWPPWARRPVDVCAGSCRSWRLAELLGAMNGLAVAIARAVTAADVEPYSWAQSRGR
jgi:hypothetical protein